MILILLLAIALDNEVQCVYSDYNSDKLIFRLRLNNLIANKKRYTDEIKSIRSI